MTKKDYIILADRIGRMVFTNRMDTASIDELCTVLVMDNHKFDKVKFLSYIEKHGQQSVGGSTDSGR